MSSPARNTHLAPTLRPLAKCRRARGTRAQRIRAAALVPSLLLAHRFIALARRATS